MKKALLVGNSKFIDPQILPLSAPRSDIEELKDVLEDKNIGDFDSVITKFDIGLEDFQIAVSDLFRNAQRDDLIVFYYAGHGLRDIRGKLHLALPKTRSDAIWATALKTRFILEQMQASKSEKLVIILDCCHAGAVVKDGDLFMSRDAVDEGLLDESFIPKGKGTYVLAACQPGEKAYEQKGGSSVFTRTLIDGIITGEAAPEKETLTVNDIHTYIDEQRLRNKVLGLDNPFTEPLIISSQSKPLEFCRNPNMVKSIDPELVADLLSGKYRTRLGAVSEIAKLLSDTDFRLVERANVLLKDQLQYEFDIRVKDMILKALNEKTLVKSSMETDVKTTAEDRISLIERKLVRSRNVKFVFISILLIIFLLPLFLFGFDSIRASVNEQNSTNGLLNETVAENIDQNTFSDLRAFIKRAEKEISQSSNALANFQLSKEEKVKKYSTRFILNRELALKAHSFQSQDLTEDHKRKLTIIENQLGMIPPKRSGAALELAEIVVRLETVYAHGSGIHKGKPANLAGLSAILRSSSDPEELQNVWNEWRAISPPMRDDYIRMVAILNEGSRELGFSDIGELEQSHYDIPAIEFEAEVQRLWRQVQPLYYELHCYVRAKLNEKYGDDIVPVNEPIRADILGEMWAQDWSNIFGLLQPFEDHGVADNSELVIKAGHNSEVITKFGEEFFVSLGFESLPESFWFEFQKNDQHDSNNVEGINAVYHSLAHSIYQRAYNSQDYLFKLGANDAFHEGVAGMVSLSVNPDYLWLSGLIDVSEVPNRDADLNLLMKRALEDMAFLPFGMVVDEWRWKVFNGTYSPDKYNVGWWELREKYQGVKPPIERAYNAFDPGAKYHVPANVSYSRYFLSHILKYQLHESACEMINYVGPLHKCTIYRSKDVGLKLDAMMKLGASRPWPEALDAFTGTEDLTGTSMIAYYRPLLAYLQEQNENRTCGW